MKRSERRIRDMLACEGEHTALYFRPPRRGRPWHRQPRERLYVMIGTHKKKAVLPASISSVRRALSTPEIRDDSHQARVRLARVSPDIPSLSPPSSFLLLFLLVDDIAAPILCPGGLVVTGCQDRKSTRLNSSHSQISYAVFCLKKKN